MRLEHLCDLRMRYVGDSVWIKTYGEKEAAGYGQGDGTVTGERLKGTLHWTNHPRRREDGVWCPDVHGYIVTEDDVRILMTFQGYSILEEVPGEKRGIVSVCTFTASDPKYRWLNFVLAVSEGEIDEETEEVVAKVFECINEIASGPSALQ